MPSAHADQGRAEDVPSPELTGACGRRPTSRWRRWRDRITPSPTPGAKAAHHASSRAREVRRAGPPDLRRGNALLDTIIEKKLAGRREVYGLFPAHGVATTSSLHRRYARRSASGSTAAADHQDDGEPVAWATSVAPRALSCATTQASPLTGIGLPRSAITSTKDDYNAIMAARRWPTDLAEALPRTTKLVRDARGRWPPAYPQGAAHQGGVPRHPSGGRLPRLVSITPRRGRLAAARRREADRHAADRIVRHVAGLQRQRPLFSSFTPSPATSRWEDRSWTCRSAVRGDDRPQIERCCGRT